MFSSAVLFTEKKELQSLHVFCLVILHLDHYYGKLLGILNVSNLVLNPLCHCDNLEIDENNALVLMAYLFIAPHLNRTTVQQHGSERTVRVSLELQTRRSGG